MKRPRGITIVALILVALGILSILFGGLAEVIGLAGGDQALIETDKVTLLEAVGVVYLIVGAGQVVVAWALWHLKRWAWWLTVILQGVSVLQALAAMAFTEVTSVDIAVFSGLILSLAILGYFLTRRVRAAFGYGPVLGS